jgi:hypothetical protein
MVKDNNWFLCHSYTCPFLKIQILSPTGLVNILKMRRKTANVDEREALNVAAK